MDSNSHPEGGTLHFDNYLCRDLKMTSLKSEQSIYVRFTEDRSQYLILGVNVDGIIIAGPLQ